MQGTAIQQQVRDAVIQAKTKEQLGKRTMTIGYHQGHLNPLPASWHYPENIMNMVQMITLYQMGSPSDGVPPLKVLAAPQVNHFDKEGATLSRMRRVMNVVKHFGEQRGVWKPHNVTNFWNGGTVTKLWDGIWNDVKPYLVTRTDKPTGVTYHKSRTGALAWRTGHDKFRKFGLFEQLDI